MNKRFLAISTLLALLLTGCTSKSATPTSPAETQPTIETTMATEATEATVPTVPQKPMLSLSLPVYREQNKEGDVVIFEHIYQKIDLIIPESDIADRISKDFQKRTDTADLAQQINEWAVDSYPIFADNWAHYLCQVTYQPMRFDSAVLSLYGTHAYFADMHFTEGTYKAVTYDITTGKVLKLNNILPNISRDELKQTVLSSLDARASEIELYDDYRQTVTQRFSGSLSQDTDWYLGHDGLYFYFSPYEIAPRSSGVITVQIPYSQLAGKMDDAYFPPEQETSQGSIRSIEYTEENAKQFTQVAELALQKNEKTVLFYTDFSISNLEIELGYFDGNQFISQYTIYSTPNLTPGDAVKLECGNEDLGSIRITYKSAEQTHHLYFDVNAALIYN